MKKVLLIVLAVVTFILFGCMDSNVTKNTDETVPTNPLEFLKGKSLSDLTLVSSKATSYATVYGTVKLPDGTYAPYSLENQKAEFVKGEYVVYYEGDIKIFQNWESLSKMHIQLTALKEKKLIYSKSKQMTKN
jgi:serine protease